MVFANSYLDKKFCGELFQNSIILVNNSLTYISGHHEKFYGFSDGGCLDLLCYWTWQTTRTGSPSQPWPRRPPPTTTSRATRDNIDRNYIVEKSKNNYFKACQDFEDSGKLRCLCKNGSRRKNKVKILTIFLKIKLRLIPLFYCAGGTLVFHL